MKEIGKVLFVTGQLSCGGLERQLFNLAQAMSEAGVRIKVASFNRDGDFYSARLRALGVGVEFLSGGLARLSQLRALARSWRPEVVHSFANFTNFPTWLAVRGLPIVAIGSWRSGFRGAFVSHDGPLRFWLNTHWPRTIVVNSVQALKDARAALRERARDYVVVENGINLKEFRLQDPPSSATCELLGIGSLTRTKRWDRALRVVGLLKDKGLRVRLSIAGEGILREPLQRLAQDLRLEGSIRFLGLVKDVAGLIPLHHCVIHTSESEGAPNAALEALACGRPVVAMNAGDVERILQCQDREMLIEQGNEGEMAAMLEKLIISPSSFERIGRANRAWIEKNYSIELSARRMLGVYEETRRRHGRRPS